MQIHTASSGGEGTLSGREMEETRLPLPGGVIRPPAMVAGMVEGATCKQWHLAPICRAGNGSRNTGTVSYNTLMQCVTQLLAWASG